MSYFGTPTFRRLAPLTQASYARSLREILSYLESQGLDWRGVSMGHVLDYENWRRRDEENESRVTSGATFARELAAIRHFLTWATTYGLVAFPVAGLQGLRPSNVRSNDVKWLTSQAYHLWRDVGLRGYGSNGLPDPAFRGRNKMRNSAFAEVMWRSGLRLREAGTLLLQEVPSRPQPRRVLAAGRIGEAVAKGRGRRFWMERAGIAAVEGYRRTARAASVARAHAQGRYDDLAGLKIVEHVTKRGHLVYRDEKGSQGTVSLDNLDAISRQRVFVESAGKIEPAMVWLSESGMPMKHMSWQMVFHEADQRCAREGFDEIFCYPHMLRHSYALRWLSISLFVFDKRFNITPEQREYYRKQFGDAYEFVQRLLGHKSVETTREIYTEPAVNIARKVIQVIARKVIQRGVVEQRFCQSSLSQ
jgi:site-specific recombinase XerD